MNGTGPDKAGKMTGRGLGFCKDHTDEEIRQKLGKGLAQRRQEGGGQGHGKRLKSGNRK